MYAQKRQCGKFAFNEEVVKVFPDMIRRSASGYTTIVENIGNLAPIFAKENSLIYDLGSSLGAVSMVLRSAIKTANTSIIAIDNSAAMVEKSREYLKAQEMMFESLLPIEVIEADITTYPYERASLFAMNFTLQFIPREKRLALLTKIADSLLPGGALFMSEKLRFEDAREHEVLNNLHMQFKRSQGYSELEIAQKRESLEDVMKIDTFEEHKARLLKAGFSEVYLWFQCLNFSSILAIK
ncbi:carboxy-S-adenosyl-L-methionine synthase CmoA [Ignatzschineria rhizosphaerae]|uniref:Carboxy-S-adenosyl-L-methionine synthase n=1 Tax=Ignatzschineria rhizosphaerae TaxID=2923279 RepID=A0ABY3X3S0_9GAMM|nr:carboxy-S-adenosyl-L-methionine synthase CmoA [Ignatzschineria rhizosphaerae]